MKILAKQVLKTRVLISGLLLYGINLFVFKVVRSFS